MVTDHDVSVVKPDVSVVVDGAELFGKIVLEYERFVKLEEGASVALAAWTLYSHSYDAFKISPLLTIFSPERRCGKSTLLEVIGHLTPNPVITSHTTTSAIFRLIEAEHPTLIIDEGDAFIKGDEDMRGILNSGHVRHAAHVLRVKPDTFEPVKLSTWCPKVIALIGSLPGTLMDRSIRIPMRRKLHGEKIEKFRLDLADELFLGLHKECSEWAKTNFEVLKKKDPAMPDWLNDRAADNWRPLMAIAELVGGPWKSRLEESIAQLESADEDDESIRVQLLIDLQSIFTGLRGDRISSADLVEALCRLGHRPWATYNRGHQISERQIARLLKPFGILPKTVRYEIVDGLSGTAKGYLIEDFSDAFTRYLPSPIAAPEKATFKCALEMLRCYG